MKTRTTPLLLTKSIDPARNILNSSAGRCGFLLIPLVVVVAWLAPVPAAWADCRQGCGPGSNTYLGNDALLINNGISNTAVGGYALTNNTSGFDNTAIGDSALFLNTTGYHNTATGNSALYSNTGAENTANGFDALFNNTTGGSNTATGSEALVANSSGSNNTANGFGALSFNNGSNNTAGGAYALYSNTANNNTATGYAALYTNRTGGSNPADGFAALYKNTTGNYNTANGYAALYGNTTGGYNTANGYAALYNNTTGGYNTGAGFKALNSNTTGGGNTADGISALYKNTTGSANTAVGLTALYYNTTGVSNIALGSAAGVNLTTGNYNIDIGNAGVAGEANTIRIGKVGTQTNAYMAGIYGVTAASGVGVFIDSNGHLGTATSSARFKDEIKPMNKASESILALQPVTFRYKKDLDPAGIPQFGLVAEDVAKVNPDLVAHDEQGKPYTVRYEAVNAMLLNEFLKEHRKVEALEAKMAQQESANSDQQKVNQGLTTSMKEQAAQIQKVSDQLKVHKSAPRVVVNNQ